MNTDHLVGTLRELEAGWVALSDDRGFACRYLRAAADEIEEQRDVIEALRETIEEHNDEIEALRETVRSMHRAFDKLGVEP